MFRRTAIDLGLDLVLQSVSNHALSPQGARAILNANPTFDREAFLDRQGKVGAVIYAIAAASAENNMRVESFPDIADVFDSIVKSPTSSLEGEQVFNVGLFIRSARLLRTVLGLSFRLDCKDRERGVDNVIEDIPESLLFSRAGDLPHHGVSRPRQGELSHGQGPA